MNERILELVEESNISIRYHYDESGSTLKELEKFAELIVKDMMIVVAAHALSGDSAVDVFANLKRIYES